MAFVKRANTPRVGFNVAVLMSNKPKRGEVGLEIEVEGNKFPKHSYQHQPAVDPELIPPEWKYVKDGSLRGHDNAEYIFAEPLTFGEAPDAVNRLFQMFDSYGSVLDESNRTSVHVHLNCQQFHLNRLTSFIAIYYALEEILTEWCGDHRVGNLFCLRAKDCPAIIAQVRDFIRSDGEAWGSQIYENMHYAGLNIAALQKYGSIEVRTLQGCRDPQTIINWTAILERLYRLSAEYPDPRTICEMFSCEGPLAFFDNLVGDMAGIIRAGVSMSDDDIRSSMYEGIRMAQDVCYCRDWGVYSPMQLQSDPFGRDTKKMAKKLMGQDVAAVGGAPAQTATLSTGSSQSLAFAASQLQNVTESDEPDVPMPAEWWVPDYYEEG